MAAVQVMQEPVEKVVRILPPRRLRGLLSRKAIIMRRALIELWQRQERYVGLDRMLGWMNQRTVPADGEVELRRMWNEVMRGVFTDTMRTAAESGRVETVTQVRGLFKTEEDPGIEAMEEWIEEHTGEALDDFSQRQLRDLRDAIYRAVIDEELSAEEVARIIQRSIGLTSVQTAALQRQYKALRAEGVPPARAKKLIERRRKEMRAQRARDIAETEIAAAWNLGGLEAVLAMQRSGEISRLSTKTWYTERDERVCPICAPLHKETVYVDQQFRSDLGRIDAPPAHPRCRCGLEYGRRKVTQGRTRRR